MIERKYLFFLILIVLLSSALRIYRIDRMALWGDEACMVFLCQDAPAEIIEALASSDRPDVDVAPPLYFLMLHFWMKLFGSSIQAFRGLSVVFGVLTVWSVIKLGESLFDRKTGLTAGVLMAISPFQIWYSQEGRMYAMASFLAVCTMWSLAVAQKNPGKPVQWIPFAVSGIALIMTQYYGILLVGALGIHAILMISALAVRRRQAAVCFAGVILFWILAFLPWMPVLLRDYFHAGAPGGFPLMFHWLLTPVFITIKSLLFGTEMYIRDHWWIYPLPLIAVLFLLFTAVRRWSNSGIRMLVIASVLPFGIVYTLSLAGLRIYKSHPFIIFQPALITLVAFGFMQMHKRYRWIYGTVIGLAQIYLLATLVLGGNYVKPRVNDTVKWIQAKSGVNSAVAVVPAFIPNPLPIVGDLLAFRYHSSDRMNTKYLTGSTSEEIVESVKQHAKGSDVLFLVYQDNLEVKPFVQQVIQELNRSWSVQDTGIFPSRNRGFSMTVIKYDTRSL